MVRAAGGDEVAGGVEQAVAQPFRFGVGHVAVEDEQPGPGEQVVGDEGELQPDGVDGEGVRWQVGQSGGFGVADLSFGAATSAVERFEVGDVSIGQVGDEHLVTVPVDIGEGQLGAGVWVFASGDDAASLGPAGQVDEVGDLDHFGVFTQLDAVGGDRRRHARSGTSTRTLAMSMVSWWPITNRTWRSRQCSTNPCDQPAESTRAITSTCADRSAAGRARRRAR